MSNQGWEKNYFLGSIFVNSDLLFYLVHVFS